MQKGMKDGGKAAVSFHVTSNITTQAGYQGLPPPFNARGLWMTRIVGLEPLRDSAICYADSN
jgi:hypothetical protein